MKKILGIFVLLVALASCSPSHIEIGNYRVIDTLDVLYDNFGNTDRYRVIVETEDSTLHYGTMSRYGNVQYLNPKPIMNLKRAK